MFRDSLSIGCPETSVTTNQRCVKSQKGEELISTAKGAWNHESRGKYSHLAINLCTNVYENTEFWLFFSYGTNINLCFSLSWHHRIIAASSADHYVSMLTELRHQSGLYRIAFAEFLCILFLVWPGSVCPNLSRIMSSWTWRRVFWLTVNVKGREFKQHLLLKS